MNRIGDSLFCTGVNEEIIRAFEINNVEFLIVGGLAVSWYCATRQADDMDLLVNPTINNSEKIYTALSSLHLQGIEKQAFAKCGVQLPLKNRYYADIITPPNNSITFEDAMNNAVKGKIFNIAAFIPSIENLLKLKIHALKVADKESEKHSKDIELLNNLGQTETIKSGKS